MRVISLFQVAAISLVISGCASSAQSPRMPPSGVDATASWARVQRDLPGTWSTTTGSGASLEVTYRGISHGSAVLETFGSVAERQTVSVYHPDGRALMMTHYCGQGNQVRLRATLAKTDRVVFTYVDATNVTGDQSAMHELVFVFGDRTLDRTEVYRAADGTSETTVLHFVKAAAPTLGKE